jgi:branched-chain amino acid aminotransferase
MNFICFNGKFLSFDEPLFTSQNRGFRYGDGVFETIKVYKSKILFEQFHYDRLFLGLKMLQIQHDLSSSNLTSQILELCGKNHCIESARVRLAVYRNDESKAEFVIETSHLSNEVNKWNEKGLAIDLYPYARKNPDAFSNLKTANFLPYILAELFSKEKRIDDAIVLNAFNNIADSSKANIFLIRKNEIFTPAMHQGCVSGVMRRFLLDELKRNDYHTHQQEITEQQLFDADEVFLTNSIYDMRWVEKFRDKTYSCNQSFSIYKKIISPLYS